VVRSPRLGVQHCLGVSTPVHHVLMTRISVEVNDEWLDAARQALGTETKVATINEALRIQALRVQGRQIAAAFDDAQMDFGRSEDAFGYGGGRDLSRLAEAARDYHVAWIAPKGSL
jgi:Arc/MetJ family transcription regulator